mgnify:CR=1 FL=1
MNIPLVILILVLIVLITYILYKYNPLGVIIWSKINWINVGQDTENQYLEVDKQPTFMTNIVRNYFRVLEVISSLNFELDFKSGIGRKPKMSDKLYYIDESLLIERFSVPLENEIFFTN